MPRNSSGVYTLPQAAFVPNTTISSSAVNSDFSDIASALTTSLATTGVSTMTGQLKAVGGNATGPGYTFGGSLTDGIYLAGTHQIGVTTNGIQALTINSDQSVTLAGNLNSTGTTTLGTIAGTLVINSTSYTFGAGAANGWWLGLSPNADVAMIIDGGGSVISSGAKGQIHIPFSLTINSWRVMADQSGSITIDVRRAHNAVPSTSIVGSGNTPTLSSAQFAQTAVSGWTATTLVADDWIDFNVTGTPSSVQRVAICLSCVRTSNT